MNIFKIIGLSLMAFAAVDFIGSYSGFDIWGSMGFYSMPDLLWTYSAHIEGLLGFVLFNVGKSE